MIINGDGGYGLLAAYIGGLAAQVGWLGGPKVGGHLAPFLYSSREPSELLLVETHLTATECHLPYGITQCYLPPDTSEHTPPSPQPVRPVLEP